MEVPAGLLAKLWSFVSVLPFFFLLFILGLLKAAIRGPVVVGIIVTGNSAVVIGLWPAHFLWTYFCVARTKRLGLVLKIVVLVSLVLPLVLWPVVAIFGSLLGGIGLQGIVTSMSRIPTFRCRIRNIVKLLYIETIQAGTGNHIGGILKARYSGKRSSGRGNRKDRYENDDIVGNRAYENEDVV